MKRYLTALTLAALTSLHACSTTGLLDGKEVAFTYKGGEAGIAVTVGGK